MPLKAQLGLRVYCCEETCNCIPVLLSPVDVCVRVCVRVLNLLPKKAEKKQRLQKVICFSFLSHKCVKLKYVFSPSLATFLWHTYTRRFGAHHCKTLSFNLKAYYSVPKVHWNVIVLYLKCLICDVIDILRVKFFLLTFSIFSTSQRCHPASQSTGFKPRC